MEIFSHFHRSQDKFQKGYCGRCDNKLPPLNSAWPWRWYCDDCRAILRKERRW